MGDIEQLVLSSLAGSANGEIEDTWAFAEANAVDHQALLGVIKSLDGDLYVSTAPLSMQLWALTGEGEQFLENGSPEFRVYNQVKSDANDDGMDMTALQEALGDIVKIGLGPCMKSKWLSM